MNRGWLLVVIGVLISSFLGGAIRVTFSPERMRSFVESLARKKEPKFELQFENAELMLQDGFWPVIAVNLNGVKIYAKDPCVTGSTLNVDRLTVPFSLGALLEKKIRFGRIRADAVRFDHRAAACTPSPELKAQTNDDIFSPLERFFRERWNKEVLNSKRYFDEFYVGHFELFSDSETPVFSINRFALHFEDDSAAKINLEFVPGYRLAAVEPFGPTFTEINIQSDEVRFSAKGNLKEGQFNMEGIWDVDAGRLELHHGMRDVPVKHLLSLAQHWELFPSVPVTVKNAWARCKIEYLGPIREWRNHPIRFEDCHVYGDIGKASLVTEYASLAKIYPLDVKLAKSRLRRSLESVGFARSWGFIRDFGDFTGNLRLESATQVELTGVVSDAQIFLSTMRDQTFEVVDSLAIALAFADGRFSGQLSNIVVSADPVEGFMTFNLDADGTGAVQLAVDGIRLSPNAQQVLFGGRVPNISVFGQGELARLQLARFDGEVGLSEISNGFVDIHGAKVKVAGDLGRWTLTPRVDSVFVKPEGPWSTLTSHLRGALPETSPDIVYKDIKGQMELRDGILRWSHLTGRVDPGKSMLGSDGQWLTDGTLDGWIQLEDKTGGPVRWIVSGSVRKPSITASEIR